MTQPDSLYLVRLALLLSIVLAAIPVGDAFGDAAASAKPVSAERIEITLQVVVPSGGTVVAHLLEPGADERVEAMTAMGGGRYQAVFETVRSDLVVVFEAIGADGLSSQSQPRRLSELGVDSTMLSLSQVIPGTTVPPAPTENRWGWLALATGAAALSALAIWSLGSRRRSEDDEPEPAVDTDA